MDPINEQENKKVNKEENKIIYYVGIGASAGGLEALEQFFSHMPLKSGLAFIVIQHLSPDYKSLMVELLSKKTELNVKRAEDGEAIQPDYIYLIPPKKNLSIFHGKLLLRESDHSKGINLPIDVFLRSLAEDQGEKAIGIILSGTGSDGVRGIRSVKEAGGLIMVQSEETAKFDGMPRAAISTGLVDFILPPEVMPEKLISLLKHPYTTKTEIPQALISNEDGLTRIFALLRERTKVDFTFYKPSTVVRRIERRMTVNQISLLMEYVRYLETHPAEISILYKELLIGVTNFFRDKEVFDELYENYFAGLLIDRERTEIRIWVAGCSTGEEAYSLAILFKEFMEMSQRKFDVKIFATDIDKDAIVYAGNGIYPESIAADIPPRYLSKYFHRKEDRFQIDRAVREMVVFAQHNLIKDPPFTNIDLISCRNLLIYLQPVLQRKVMSLMNFSLRPQGILLLGTSETTGDAADLFEPAHHKFKIYKSRGKKNTAASGNEFLLSPDIKSRAVRARYSAGSANSHLYEEERLLDRILNSLSGEYIPLCIVVNEQLEVVHIIGDAGEYFRLPSGKLTNDITKMAIREIAIPLATGLQKVLTTHQEVRYSYIKLQKKDEYKNIDIRIKMLSAKKGQADMAAIFIQESLPRTAESLTANEAKAYDLSQEAEQRIHDLELELQFTRENLQATIEELETANEELQATNEELLASNEELQSTNEELQSVNEELHTVNVEYQSKIIELTELNNDLDNLFQSTRIGTLFLDENLDIRKFTPEVQHIFRIIHSDIGRSILHLNHNMLDVDIFTILKRVVDSNKHEETEVKTRDGSWYFCRIMPYKIGGGSFSGVVIIFFDISLLKNTQFALLDNERKLSSIFRVLPSGTGLIRSKNFAEINDTLCRMLGYSREELLGSNWENVFASKEEFQRIVKNIPDLASSDRTAAVETAWNRKDSSKISVLLSITMLNLENSDDGFIFTALDITARKKALEDVRSLQDKYGLLFNTMTEGVVFHDVTGKIISANSAACRLLGLTMDQMMGKTSFDPRWRAVKLDGSPYEGKDHPAMITLKTGKPVSGAIMGVFNPVLEKICWIKINAVPLFDDNSTVPKQVYATFDDITQVVETENEIIRARERLNHALNVAGFAWWDWNIITGKVEASDLKGRMLGFEPGEFESVLEFWTSRIHPDDYENTMEAMRNCLTGKCELYKTDYRIKCRDGSYRRFIDVGKVVEWDNQGKPVRMIGTVHDPGLK